MKNQLLILWALLFAVGCMTMKKVRKDFAENKVEIVTELIPGDKDAQKSLLVIVFNDNDTGYDKPITQLMKIDTSRSDVGTYKILCKEFTVVKLHRSDFEKLLAGADKFKHKETIQEDYKALDPKKPFAFLCSYRLIQLYGARYLDSDKAWLHDLIDIGWGP